MPGFSTWGPPSSFSTRVAPLTPPDYDLHYSSRPGDHTYYGQHASQQYRSGQMNDGYKQYTQPPAYSAHQAHTNNSSRLSMQASHDFGHGARYASGLPATRVPDVAATMLPPLRGKEVMDPYGQYAPSNLPFVQKQKEEKATGGVAAHLDYDIPMMSDFVAEMSQGMYTIYLTGIHLSDIDLMRSVNSSAPVEAQYRKYVTQILTSTRLPSSTIMLGLFYLAERLKILQRRGVDIRSRDTVYRMLTTCLLLGSKFLDDNTFQNRSWAEVSNINVKELNKMELDWLQDFDWCIHSRMYDQQDGFYMWREMWLVYAKDAELQKIKDAQNLAPIDTNLTRHRSIHKPMMSPEGPIPAQYQRKPQFDTQWVSPLISEPSPPSAAYSGPATPEYYSSATWNYGHPSAYSNQAWSSNSSTPAYMSSRSHSSYQPKSSYPPHYMPGSWNTHGHGCGCTIYSKCKDHYFLSSNHYSMQTVAC